MESTYKVEQFYRRLLALETVIDPTPLIMDAVTLLGEVMVADLAHVEIFASDPSAPVPFTSSHPAGVPSSVSRDMVHAAVKERVTISVGSTLCTPIRTERPVGVLYIQRSDEQGTFLENERRRAELFATRLALVADRIRLPGARPQLRLDDEIHSLEERAVRAALARHAGNISNAARELGTTRPRLYRIMRRSEARRVRHGQDRVDLPHTPDGSGTARRRGFKQEEV